jgi:hypothetical protein
MLDLLRQRQGAQEVGEVVGEGMELEWNSSLIRRSKSTRRGSAVASPIGYATIAPRPSYQPTDRISKIGRSHHQTFNSPGLKSIVAALALVGASIAFALGAAEACLRLFPELMPEEAQVRLHWQDVGKPISQADPYLGHVFPANQLGRIERSDGNFAFTYTTDEHGFRNRSPWPERADIVVLGDSMAFGYGVEDDQAWPTLLEENLPDSRVINLGLIGAAPQQYFRIYKTFGQALQPSLVLFCLFPGNDVTDAGFSTSG